MAPNPCSFCRDRWGPLAQKCTREDGCKNPNAPPAPPLTILETIASVQAREDRRQAGAAKKKNAPANKPGPKKGAGKKTAVSDDDDDDDSLEEFDPLKEGEVSKKTGGTKKAAGPPKKAAPPPVSKDWVPKRKYAKPGRPPTRKATSAEGDDDNDESSDIVSSKRGAAKTAPAPSGLMEGIAPTAPMGGFAENPEEEIDFDFIEGISPDPDFDWLLKSPGSNPFGPFAAPSPYTATGQAEPTPPRRSARSSQSGQGGAAAPPSGRAQEEWFPEMFSAPPDEEAPTRTRPNMAATPFPGDATAAMSAAQRRTETEKFIRESAKRTQASVMGSASKKGPTSTSGFDTYTNPPNPFASGQAQQGRPQAKRKPTSEHPPAKGEKVPPAKAGAHPPHGGYGSAQEPAAYSSGFARDDQPIPPQPDASGRRESLRDRDSQGFAITSPGQTPASAQPYSPLDFGSDPAYEGGYSDHAGGHKSARSKATTKTGGTGGHKVGPSAWDVLHNPRGSLPKPKKAASVDSIAASMSDVEISRPSSVRDSPAPSESNSGRSSKKGSGDSYGSNGEGPKKPAKSKDTSVSDSRRKKIKP